MKNDYIQETVDVTCTDTQVTVTGTIISQNQDRIRVDIGGVVMTFTRTSPGLYVSNMSGLEFTFRL
jgi:hypothetical protein